MLAPQKLVQRSYFFVPPSTNFATFVHPPGLTSWTTGDCGASRKIPQSPVVQQVRPNRSLKCYVSAAKTGSKKSHLLPPSTNFATFVHPLGLIAGCFLHCSALPCRICGPLPKASPSGLPSATKPIQISIS